MASELITLAEGALLSKFVEPFAEGISKAVMAQGERVVAAAHQLLTAAGREPQPVPLATLVPLVQAAALQEGESMASKWASLLANAADPAQRVQVQPAFGEILRQLTPNDARILDALYFPEGTSRTKPSAGGSRMIKQFVSGLELSYAEVSLSVDNLLRLRLCMASEPKPGMFGASLTTPGEVRSTVLGQQFLLACTPPTV
jgi:hypothetical protein